MPLSGHSEGTYPETSSHEARQGTLGHGHLSSLSHYGLILSGGGFFLAWEDFGRIQQFIPRLRFFFFLS